MKSRIKLDKKLLLLLTLVSLFVLEINVNAKESRGHSKFSIKKSLRSKFKFHKKFQKNKLKQIHRNFNTLEENDYYTSGKISERAKRLLKEAEELAKKKSTSLKIKKLKKKENTEEEVLRIKSNHHVNCSHRKKDHDEENSEDKDIKVDQINKSTDVNSKSSNDSNNIINKTNTISDNKNNSSSLPSSPSSNSSSSTNNNSDTNTNNTSGSHHHHSHTNNNTTPNPPPINKSNNIITKIKETNSDQDTSVSVLDKLCHCSNLKVEYEETSTVSKHKKNHKRLSDKEKEKKNDCENYCKNKKS